MRQLKNAVSFVGSFLVLVALICPSPARAQDGWGNLTGKIIVEGQVPEAEALTIETADRTYCLATGQEFRDRSLLVGSNGGLQDAYVMMYFARGDDRRPAVHPSYEDSIRASIQLTNKNCRFEPRSIAVRTGQKLKFSNSDSIGHNCHVATMKNEENISLGAGQSLELVLENADSVPGIVKCDVHPWMEALILVRDEPYLAITDEQGNFRIENIPAGEWSFQFWHKRRGYLKTLTRDDQSVVGRRGELTVTIQPGETTDLGELKVAVDELVK